MFFAASIAFWASLLGISYAYVGYPILIRYAASYSNKNPSNAAEGDQGLSEITVLITAYNAGPHLRDRIVNILACEYPSQSIRILVASDGSTDETGKVVREFDDERVRVIEYPNRRGKSATLVDAVGMIDSPVVVFTDATTRFDRRSLAQLSRHFSDHHVGLVAGTVRMVDSAGKPTESLYWKVEMTLRRCETKLGITMGASGAIYAVRKSMFVAPSKPIINDDLVLPILVRLNHDCGLVLDETALGYVTSGGGLRSEFSRRSRIGIGAFQCLPVLKDLWRFRNRRMAAVFVSHKLLRWLCPFLLVSAFVSNAILISQPVYQCIMVAQTVAYVAAFIGLLSPGEGVAIRLSRIATSFVLMNAALAVGVFRWIAKPDTVTWNPTARPRWQPVKTTAGLDLDSRQRAA